MNGLQECGGMLNNEIKIENMKNSKLILLVVIIILFGLSSCGDQAEDPVFTSDDVPRIFGWINNTNNDYLLNVNDTLKINLQVSPSNEASYQWFIDDVEVGETRDLTYKFNEAKRYIVKFMVTRYGITNSRQTKVLVNK
jgi:hypothetical protein